MKEESSTKLEVSRKFPTFFTALIFVSIFTLIIVIWFYFDNPSNNFELSKKQDIWGMFGDYFGGILGPVFAFYALMALLYSIYLQKIGRKKGRYPLLFLCEKQNAMNKKITLPASDDLDEAPIWTDDDFKNAVHRIGLKPLPQKKQKINITLDPVS